MQEDKIVEPFIEQYDVIRKFLNGKKKIVIGTMGSESTSSVQAAKFFCENIKELDAYEFRLFPDFKALLNAAHTETEMDFALVPSAYERVTDFFWDMKLENCMNFIFPTPQYGLVCKNDYHIDNNENITIATCHAVENIIEELSDGRIKDEQVEKIFTPSTTTALQEVIKGNADIAVTNETSFDLYKDRDIRFIYRKYNAKIVWCLFRKKGEKSGER